MNYLNSRDAKVELLPVDAVPSTWNTFLDMFKQTLEHEKKVTSLINNLAAIANEDRDFASINRLNWFIDEQIEEEESARDMIFTVGAVENDKYGMYMLDKELAARVYNVPSPLATAAE
jgi:ferritin